MFLNNAIYGFLNSSVDNQLLKSGTDYLKNNEHPQCYIKTDSKIIVVIFATERILIVYKNAFVFESFKCSCDQNRYCQHLVASILHLAKLKDSELLLPDPEVSEYIESFYKTEDAKFDTYTLSVPPSEKENTLIKRNKVLHLIDGPVKQYKLLPFDNIAHFKENLRNLRVFSYPELDYNNHYKYYVLGSGELEVKQIKKTYHWSRKDEEGFGENCKIIFKREYDKLYVRCPHCDLISTKFCSHQSEILSKAEVINFVFSDRWHNANQEFESLGKLKQMPVEKIKKLYAIEYFKDFDKVSLVKVNKNYISSEEVQKILEPIKLAEVTQEYKINSVSDQLSEVKANMGNALLWDISATNKSIFPQLIEGTLNKTLNKFTGNIEIASDPKFLSDDKRDWFNKVKNLSLSTRADAIDWSHELLLSFMKNSLDTPLEIINYWYDENKYTGTLTKNNINNFTFSKIPAQLEISVVEDGDFFYKLQYLLKLGDTRISIKNRDLKFHPCFVIKGEAAFLFDNKNIFAHISALPSDHFLFDKDDRNQLMKLIKEYAKQFHVEVPEGLKIDKTIPNTVGKVLYLRDAGQLVIFDLKLLIDEDLKISIPSTPGILIADESEEEIDQLLYIGDDVQQDFIRFIEDSHPSFVHSYQHTGVYYLEVREMIRDVWFLGFFEKCRQNGIKVFGQENLKNFRFNTHAANINIKISSGIDWFDVNVNISFGNKKLALKQWVDAVSNNERYVLLDDGTLGLIPDEWYEKLKHLRMVGESDKEGLRISKYRIGAIDEFFDELKDDKLYLEIRDKILRLQNHQIDKDYEIPKAIKAELRDYQVSGYQWLKSLNELNFGACLADDMGLGKTLQVLCLLADQKEMDAGTSLVVVPRSLLFNWASEIDKFCPSLTYVNYHGTQRRELVNDLLDYDIVITTYDTATNDIEILRELPFNYIILDESQAIKNPASQRYKAMRLLNAQNRLVMTGTPIENNTFDLYAQFSFVNPGIFGSQQSFKDKYAVAIDKNGDEVSADFLRKIINPFLLRRTKEQVAKDLPERVENVIYCDMNMEQRKFYDALKDKIREELNNSINLKGFANSKLKVIEGLLRLRQVCNAPQIVDPSLPLHQRESVKIETLMEIIENDLGHHNALVFSQFTTMLDLIRKELDYKKIKYAYLDGSTNDRKAAVDYFENNEEVKIFLISLKAGNTGLNLVKADYVYLIDPWWNPAVEAQAIDRTHRIGQTKNVFAYRFICKNTIEEKILQLQSKKKKLASDLVMAEENIFKSLEMEDMLDLFN